MNATAPKPEVTTKTTVTQFRFKKVCQIKNIARGTTDPGYWVYNLNHVSDLNQFENILAKGKVQKKKFEKKPNKC